MTKDNKYNRWTNYETWRVNLEVFDGYTKEEEEGIVWDAESVEDYVCDLMAIDVDENSLVYQYALAFLSDVNWGEIANSLNERD